MVHAGRIDEGIVKFSNTGQALGISVVLVWPGERPQVSPSLALAGSLFSPSAVPSLSNGGTIVDMRYPPSIFLEKQRLQASNARGGRRNEKHATEGGR